MSVTIALDARTLFRSARRGTGKNLLDLYREVSRLRPDWRLLMYHRSRNANGLLAGRDNILPRCIDLPGDRWDLWQRFRLPLAAWKDRADLLHCPANSCPRHSIVPVVSTIHDLIPLKISDDGSNGRADAFRGAVERCLEKSRHIITVSQSTRSDLISDFGADPRRISVIGWAPDGACRAVRDEAELARIRSRYTIDQRYLLAFSGRSRRKNAEGMIHGYARLNGALRRRIRFVLVGVEPQDRRCQLLELILKLGVQDQCVVHGFVPEADVPGLLSGAEGLAFCSLYEGFGLPILDAFACETPVLTSHVSSMPEVAGDAAVYCQPSDADSIAQGMERILCDHELRRTLVSRASRRLQLFSWEKTARGLCEVLKDCLT